METKFTLDPVDVMLSTRKRRFEAFVELKDLLLIENLCKQRQKSKSEIFRELIEKAKSCGILAEMQNGDLDD